MKSKIIGKLFSASNFFVFLLLKWLTNKMIYGIIKKVFDMSDYMI